MKTTYLIAATLALAAAQQAQDPCALRSMDIDWANVENVTPEEFYEAAGPAADVYENAWYKLPDDVQHQSTTSLLRYIKNDCALQGGEHACETGLLNREQCFAVGCCDWDDEEEACFSAVGQDVCDGEPIVGA